MVNLLFLVLLQELPNLPLSRHMWKEFASADMPLFKINDPEVRDFLPNCSERHPPDGSTFRRNYLPKCYEEILNKIRVLCEKKN